MKTFFTFIFLCLTTSLFTQDRQIPDQSPSQNQNQGFNLFDKNKTQVGGFMWGGVSNGVFNLWAQGRYGRFIAKQFSVGLEAQGQLASNFNSIITGPYARYFMLKKTISPVVEINYNYLRQNNRIGLSDFTNYGTFLMGQVGVFYMPNLGGLGAEFLLNYNLLYNIKQKDNISGDIYEVNNPNQIGVSYRITYLF